MSFNICRGTLGSLAMLAARVVLALSLALKKQRR
jgi:hypothetical protein